MKTDKRTKDVTKDITKKILFAIAGGMFLSLAIMAPGAIIAAKPLLSFIKEYDRRRVRSTIKRLEKQKILEIKETKNGQTRITITKRGEKLVLKYRVSDLSILRPKKWDGLWRVVVFDIPESINKKNRAREALREKLREFGFYKFQNSVFVFPFECEKEIEFIKAIFDIQPYVMLIRARQIDNADFLKKHFELT